ncbi:MAG: DUF3575 domain-containing protein [Bacteroidota bacterium]
MGRISINLLIFSLSVTLFLTAEAQDNIIKTSVSGFAIGDFSISYERKTSDNQSANLRIGYFQPTVSPFIGEKTITPSDYTFKDSEGALQASLEYRWYTKKQGLRGFYYGPYLRYYAIRAEYGDNIRSDNFNVSGSYNSFGTGMQLGYQFLINNIFSVDLSFFGAGIDYNTINLVYTTGIQGFDYNTIVADVSEVFEDLPYFEKRLKNKVSPNNLTSRIPFLFPGLKAGITIGVAF